MRFHFNKKSSVFSAVTQGGGSKKIICENQKVFVYFYGEISTLPNGKLNFEKSIAAVFKYQTKNTNVSKVSFVKFL